MHIKLLVEMQRRYKEKLEVFEIHKAEAVNTVSLESIEKALKLVKDNKEMVPAYVSGRAMRIRISCRSCWMKTPAKRYWNC